ncbi:MAG: GIY-YIG nuclease family protein [Bacilli bacterium]|nr:GIY-YIG nuclease family protein [Bacilli bacterium]
MKEKGYIYILTNKSFNKENLVKIGYTTNVNRRVKELSNTSVPEPFEVYATYEVEFETKMPDKALHDLIYRLNPNLRISDNREFFEMYPWDAYEMLQSMAIIHNRTDKLWRNEKNSNVSIDNDFSDNEYSIDKLFPPESEERRLFNRIKDIVKSISNFDFVVPNKLYAAIKKDKKHNFICVWPKSGWVEIVFCVKKGSIDVDSESVYDISNRMWTSAQYAMRFYGADDEKVLIETLKKMK